MYTIKLLDSSPGSLSSGAFALNSHGHAVGRTQFNVEFQPMLWKPNPTQLSFIGSSQALGINDAGDVVGFSIEAGQAFLRRSGGKPERLTKFPDNFLGFARGINNEGLITGDFGPVPEPPDLHAFIYDPNTPAAPRDLGALPGHRFSFGFAINNKRQVTGLSQGSQVKHAFFFDDEMDDEMMDLGPAAAANDLNEAGQVVGARVVNGAKTAFLCETSSGTPQFEDIGTIPLPEYQFSEASGINNNGDVVGHALTNSLGGNPRAFVRLARSAVQDLNLLIPNNSGWVLNSASGINDKGQIVGQGIFNGSSRAFLLTPESASNLDQYILAVTILIGLVGGGHGVVITIGTGIGPVDPEPFSQLALLSPQKRDMLLGIAMSELASLAVDGRSRDELEHCALNIIRRALDQLSGD